MLSKHFINVLIPILNPLRASNTISVGSFSKGLDTTFFIVLMAQTLSSYASFMDEWTPLIGRAEQTWVLTSPTTSPSVDTAAR